MFLEASSGARNVTLAKLGNQPMPISTLLAELDTNATTIISSKAGHDQCKKYNLKQPNL
jgi:hypothetical protein